MHSTDQVFFNPEPVLVVLQNSCKNCSFFLLSYYGHRCGLFRKSVYVIKEQTHTLLKVVKL